MPILTFQEDFEPSCTTDYEDCQCCCRDCCTCDDSNALISSYGTEFDELTFYDLNIGEREKIFSSRSWTSTTEKLFIGLEIELEFNTNYQRTFYLEGLYAYGKRYLGNLKNVCIPQKDGSLDYTKGVELVFQPHTLGALRRRLSLIPIPDPKTLDTERTDVGIHVNLNKNYASTSAWSKFIRFIHRNKQACIEFSGRNSSDYAAYRSLADNPTDSNYFDSAEDCKYQAVNVTGDRVEVRIFKSNFSYEKVLAYSEFCSYLIEFCKKITLGEYHDLEKRGLILAGFNWFVKYGYINMLNEKVQKHTDKEVFEICV